MSKCSYILITIIIFILLLQTVIDYEGHKCTPLIIAARNGHDKVVKIILSKFEPNIEQEGSVKVDNYVIEGATALWCAASKSQFYQSKGTYKQLILPW